MSTSHHSAFHFHGNTNATQTQSQLGQGGDEIAAGTLAAQAATRAWSSLAHWADSIREIDGEAHGHGYEHAHNHFHAHEHRAAFVVTLGYAVLALVVAPLV